jgi:glucuronosyltransferase
VSFGSILRGANMSPKTRRTFISTFSRLKQRVVWKWEDETKMSPDADLLPVNVKLVPWLPQQDLLGHPKARLFINHGGMLSNQEAVYHGVPFVAMPVFGDHFINAQKAQDDGYAINFDWDKVAQEGALYDAIQQVLNDPRYPLMTMTET